MRKGSIFKCEFNCCCYRTAKLSGELPLDEHEDAENVNIYTELCYVSVKAREVLKTNIYW